MVRIKAVDAQNILDVCELSTNQDSTGSMKEGHSCCNAIFIAKAKYDPEMHPYAIYSNHMLIGFFMYQRAENQADTATICRFMIDYRFQQKGFEEKALECILRGLKIQGVKKVVFMIDDDNIIAKLQGPSFGVRSAKKMEHDKYYCELEL